MWYFGSSRSPANIRVRRSAARTSARAQPAPLPRSGGKPFHLRLGLPRRLAELPVRRLAGIVQPQVVGQDAEDVGRVVGPAGHAQVDFRHRPVTVAAEEPGEPGLHDGGKLAGAVAADQLRHRGCVVRTLRRRTLRRRTPRRLRRRPGWPRRAARGPGPFRWSRCWEVPAGPAAAPRARRCLPAACRRPPAGQSPARAAAGCWVPPGRVRAPGCAPRGPAAAPAWTRPAPPGRPGTVRRTAPPGAAPPRAGTVRGAATPEPWRAPPRVRRAAAPATET